MAVDRTPLPTQHLLIDDDAALEAMILAALEAVESDDPTGAVAPDAAPQTNAAEGQQSGESDPQTATNDDAGAEHEAPSSYSLRYQDAETAAFDGIDGISIVSIPLNPVPAAGLLDDSSGAADTPAASLTTALEQTLQPSNPDVIALDYEPLVKPDNPGGGNGGGKGGGGGGGKGGGKPDKGGDGGDGGDPGTGVLDTYTSGPDGGYNIHIDFLGTWTEALQAAFIEAADLISNLITADVSDVTYNGTFYDDITITAELAVIDGAGGILGQAGPTLIRTGSGQPIAAIMEFDSADAENYDDAGLWNDIVIHEMLHSVGVGTVWNYAGLLDGYGTSNPLFNGEFANLAYDDLFADLNENLSDLIPVEGDGGSGTAYGHWDEATFGNELMTGYINGANYISAMTVASLEDLGYATTWDASAPAETGIGTIVI